MNKPLFFSKDQASFSECFYGCHDSCSSAASPLACFVLCSLYSLTCVAERKEVSQTDRNSDICHCRQSDGGSKWETGRHGGRMALPFSPFSSPLADSESLTKEQYDNLLFCSSMLFTVLSGLGRNGVAVELS